MNKRTWLISDTHFGHKNIVQYCQRPVTHEVIMLSEWIDRVGDDDQILHLGDVWMGGDGRWSKVLSRMPGRKFLIYGNHDKPSKRALYEAAGFEIVDEFIHNGYLFTHRPVPNNRHLRPKWGFEDWHTNVHGHIHNNGYGVTSARREADVELEAGPYYPARFYANISVEVLDLKPIQFGNIKNYRISGEQINNDFSDRWS